jgi:ATP-dependent DNA helicase RecG
LGRDRHYLRNKHLIPMVASGVLALRHPGQPNHPQQAYVVA